MIYSTPGAPLMLSRSHASAPDLYPNGRAASNGVYNTQSNLQYSNEGIGREATSLALKTLALPSSLASFRFHVPIRYNTQKLLLPSSSHKLLNQYHFHFLSFR